MRKLRRVLTIPMLVFGLIWVAPTPAGAVADNIAVAVNTKDDTYRWRQAFKIVRVNGDVVDQANAAAATASCERCRTVAVAVQVVLITGDPHTVTPLNIALAINENCNLCATYAGAFQWVITTNGPVHFTEAGSAEIDDIREDLAALIAGATFGPTEPGDDPLDTTEIEAFDLEVEAIVHRLDAVLANEVVRSGGGNILTTEDVDLLAS
jgi:hypothetical protein